MAYIGFRVPPETARLLAEVDFGDFGEKRPPGKFHVTVVYLGKDMPIDKIAMMIPAIFACTSQTRPFTASTSRVSTFSPNADDGVPIIAVVDSPPLHDFRARLIGDLKKAGIEIPERYPAYRPHVTLAYSPDPLVHTDNAVDLQIPTVEWGAHELVLWGGDNGDNRVIVTFPLSIALTKTAVQRAFVQLAQNWPAPSSPK